MTAFDQTVAAAPAGYPRRTREEVLDSAPRGYPRPIHASGLPTPYIANQADLSDADAFRRALCVAERRCQVCGDLLGPSAVVCWREGDQLVIDGAAIHPHPCWPIARSRCPELARLAATGALLSAQVPTDSLEDTIADAKSIHDGMPVAYLVPEGSKRAASPVD